MAILERTLEPDSSDEEPPPVYSPPAYHMHVLDRPYPLAPPTPPPRYRRWRRAEVMQPGDRSPSGGQSGLRTRPRFWKPHSHPVTLDELLPLPEVQGPDLDRKALLGWGWIQGREPATSRGSKLVSTEGSLPPVVGPEPRDQESRWKQYLEDERIALFLQNEEFMKELQRNRDFLLALERDRLKYESQKSTSSSVAVGNDFDFPSPVPGNSDANPAVSEDALFRDKLKHMGKCPFLCVSDEDFRGRRQEVPTVEEALKEGQ
nr:CUE domain-containing protein 1 [Odocoileus virginianus texanus]